jgi:Family of unknown function (DUF6527)
MKLIDLHPEWINLDVFEKVGVMFDCPVHKDQGCIYPRIPVYFANPPSGCAPLPKHGNDDARWQLTGTSFDNMTLMPSILYPKPKYGPMHWHGFITNGEVR